MRRSVWMMVLVGCASTPKGGAAGGVPAAPAVPDEAELVAHEVTFEVPLPPEAYLPRFERDAATLAPLLPGTPALPGVVGVARVSGPDFPSPGSVRRVLLAGGGEALEQVLEHEPRRLRYQVWGYTLESAKPVRSAVGEFRFAPSAAGTRVTWRYAFHLERERFPGWLGPLGRWLFRTTFLERDYAEFMRAGVGAMKARALVP